ncbi:hypothetical protein Slin14017_G124950 [Septoria linicola]|nr:hypothetical protein Slin14017_G124950 [Septoria linicola]
MPRMRAELPSMVSRARTAIRKAIGEKQLTRIPKVETHLVFAILALGASLHWSSSALDDSWLHEAKKMLDLWEPAPSGSDVITYAYFHHAVIYWKMLVCAASSGFKHDDLERKRHEVRGRLHKAMFPGREPIPSSPTSLSTAFQPFGGTRPSSWCGVSGEVIDLYGQVLVLCRSGRSKHRLRVGYSAEGALDTLADVTIAHEIHAELKSMNFADTISLDAILGFPVSTDDASTPISHLIQTAEAYRQAALLQIYMAFDDVLIEDTTQSGVSTRRELLVGLAIHILDILHGVPLESGSRSIHPMLYFSAATALAYDTDVSIQHFSVEPPSDYGSR